MADVIGTVPPVTPTIVGTTGDDYLRGTSGNDEIDGLLGTDVIVASKGDDVIDGGGAEYDQVDYAGAKSDYTFTQNADGTITAEHAEYGKDILKDIDGIWFEGDNVWHDIQNLA